MEEQILQEIKSLKDQIESLSLSTRDILNMDEAMTYLQVSRSYLYKLTSGKLIPHYKPTGKLIFFRRSELDQWILKNRESSLDEVKEIVMLNLKKKK
ncbi:helix-turn-helix transcriptional regulator [Flavobacterium sp. LAR06]|uniref:helix-turn-helix transcriptional regulator n=1 Tax=Flavobacterium sp. LAR06 TaxID=3064897 RepID=UPI0035C0A6D0